MHHARKMSPLQALLPGIAQVFPVQVLVTLKSPEFRFSALEIICNFM
jgi:hypothetical protein